MKHTKRRVKKIQTQPIAPNTQLISHGSTPPPLPLNKTEQEQYTMNLRKAISIVTEEFLRENQDEVIVRAMDYLKKNNLVNK